MIAEPAIFHDKFLVGNGEACKHCGGSGRTKGARGPSTSRRCKPCKGTGRGALPAEVIVANTRLAGRQAALVQAAREAREAAEISALHEEVEATAVAAAQPVEVICGIGQAAGSKVWTDCCACKVPAQDTVSRVITSYDCPLGGFGSYEAPYEQDADLPSGAYYDPRIETVCAEGCGCIANPRKRWGMSLRAWMRDGA